eukprot:scaffold23082_cov55-Attheya_sp.AAC.2
MPHKVRPCSLSWSLKIKTTLPLKVCPWDFQIVKAQAVGNVYLLDASDSLFGPATTVDPPSIRKKVLAMGERRQWGILSGA